MSENKFSRAKAAARKRVSKAERERREYIALTADAVGRAVMGFLGDHRLKEAADITRALEGERLRNEGALALARLLAQTDVSMTRAICRHILESVEEGGHQVIMWDGQQVFPLPPKEGE